jgi:hypothetical protein
MRFPAMQALKNVIANASVYDTEPKHVAKTGISARVPHSIKLPSPTHYLPGGKKYDPRIRRPEGTPVYSREGD